MSRIKRSYSYKIKMYSEFIGWKCANPNCESGINIHVHHILPIKDGGVDEYWNFICLCQECHKWKLHKDHNKYDIELFTWKSLQEIELWGFCLDEQDDNYYDNLKYLLKNKV